MATPQPGAQYPLTEFVHVQREPEPLCNLRVSHEFKSRAPRMPAPGLTGSSLGDSSVEADVGQSDGAGEPLVAHEPGEPGLAKAVVEGRLGSPGLAGEQQLEHPVRELNCLPRRGHASRAVGVEARRITGPEVGEKAFGECEPPMTATIQRTPCAARRLLRPSPADPASVLAVGRGSSQ